MALPSGYTQVEYIQSSGTQYISTGFLPNNNTRVVADLQVVEVGESVALFGARAGASVTSYMAWQISATRFRSDFNDDYTNCDVDTVLNRIVVDKNKNVCSFGNSTVTTPYSTFQCENELKLFRGSSATSVTKGSSIKLYSCQVYDNGNLIRDYIPAIQINNGEAGLYDQLNNVFYENAGSGSFTTGPIVVPPSEITPCEYIESSGKQYINTNFVPDNNTRVVADLEVVTAGTNKPLFGARTSTNVNTYMAWQTSDTSFRSDFNTQLLVCNVDTVLNRITIDKNKNVCSFGNDTVTNNNGTFQCEFELYLFTSNNNGSAAGGSSIKMYSCQIYDNGTLVRAYIPCTWNNTPGLYDSLNGLFYANSGSGEFTAGPAIPAPSAPTGLSVQSTSYPYIILAWQPSDNATGYSLYRDQEAIYSGSDTSYTDTVEPDTEYVYTVSAFNEYQTSPLSDPLNITTPSFEVETPRNLFAEYLQALKNPFFKLCRLRFLNPDGSTAFALDNNPYNPNSAAFIQSGSISCNLQNGQRRQADVTLSNLTGKFDYSINNLWFGQQIALDEGLLLPDGTEFYLPQGVFYISNPQESFMPNAKTVTLPLVDKWAYLDGTLFGNLEGIYEVPVNSNIFTAMSSVLAFDRGNGIPVDNVPPVFTNYFNNMSTALPDGSSISMLLSPYTLRVDADNGTYADILTGLATMLAAWIGYDQTGTLRIEPSQDDILDVNKPILYAFTPNEAQLLGATYTVKNTDVYNDVIIMGEALNNEPQVAGRATNMDPQSDTNIYTSLGRRTKREAAAGYYTTQQCTDLAVWKLKRMSVLQKSVTISCQQMFHIVENNLVTICRTDKPGAPVERHLITGFTRPLTQTGSMTINCTSVNDFPVATVTAWPE